MRREMERRYNEEVFTPEDVEDGLMDDLIKYLKIHNEKSDRAYYDIHITSDGYCNIVQWVSVPYNDEHYNGEFVYIDEDQVIMTEFRYPDNSFEYIVPGTEDEVMKEWSENNPDWYKNDRGIWVKNHRKEYLEDLEKTEEEFFSENGRDDKES